MSDGEQQSLGMSLDAESRQTAALTKAIETITSGETSNASLDDDDDDDCQLHSSDLMMEAGMTGDVDASSNMQDMGTDSTESTDLVGEDGDDDAEEEVDDEATTDIVSDDPSHQLAAVFSDGSQQLIVHSEDGQQLVLNAGGPEAQLVLGAGATTMGHEAQYPGQAEGELTVVGMVGDGQQQPGTGAEQQLQGSDQGLVVDGVEQCQVAQPQQLLLSTAGFGTSQAAVTLDAEQARALQELLASQGSTQLVTASGETIQVVAVAPSGQPMMVGGDSKAWHTAGVMGEGQQLVISDDGNVAQANGAGLVSMPAGMQIVDPLQGGMTEQPVLMLQPQTPLLPGMPPWAAKLRDCERIGDSFRGWVETEVELDLLLTYHKQQTQSFWGTRQSPSPAKPSTRLMWKSQYVAYDGMPFINAGSRAIVMECQFGPRRKGTQAKKVQEHVAANRQFRQTCPARIYIKKVRKFPEYAVDMTMDKKNLKAGMDRSFQALKERGTDNIGRDCFYVQLPMEKAHEFHGESVDIGQVDTAGRLHPRVVHKVREMVASGESRLYVIRKSLRRFVEKELFDCPETAPEKHNLNYYPTVNDLQNHIHQAIADIEAGILPVVAQTVNVEMVSSMENQQPDLQGSLWQQMATDQPHAETVTVTLTQNPGEDGQHIISRVETHLSDGSTQISTNLTPETAKLLSKLHPNMFPAGSLFHLQDANSLQQQQQQLAMGNQPLVLQPQLDPQAVQPTGLIVHSQDNICAPQIVQPTILGVGVHGVHGVGIGVDLLSQDPNQHQQGTIIMQTVAGEGCSDSQLSQTSAGAITISSNTDGSVQMLATQDMLTCSQGGGTVGELSVGDGVGMSLSVSQEGGGEDLTVPVSLGHVGDELSQEGGSEWMQEGMEGVDEGDNGLGLQDPQQDDEGNVMDDAEDMGDDGTQATTIHTKQEQDDDALCISTDDPEEALKLVAHVAESQVMNNTMSSITHSQLINTIDSHSMAITHTLIQPTNPTQTSSY